MPMEYINWGIVQGASAPMLKTVDRAISTVRTSSEAGGRFVEGCKFPELPSKAKISCGGVDDLIAEMRRSPSVDHQKRISLMADVSILREYFSDVIGLYRRIKDLQSLPEIEAVLDGVGKEEGRIAPYHSMIFNKCFMVIHSFDEGMRVLNRIKETEVVLTAENVRGVFSECKSQAEKKELFGVLRELNWAPSMNIDFLNNLIVIERDLSLREEIMRLMIDKDILPNESTIKGYLLGCRTPRVLCDGLEFARTFMVDIQVFADFIKGVPMSNSQQWVPVRNYLAENGYKGTKIWDVVCEKIGAR